MDGFPFKRPDFYLRADQPIQPVRDAADGRITGYSAPGRISERDWWTGVRDLWDKERCWPAQPVDVTDTYLTLVRDGARYLEVIRDIFSLARQPYDEALLGPPRPPAGEN